MAVNCPPGIAAGAFDLRNRGFDLVCEITCWPRLSRHHFRLIAGVDTENCVAPRELWFARGLEPLEQYILRKELHEALREFVHVPIPEVTDWQRGY